MIDTGVNVNKIFITIFKPEYNTTLLYYAIRYNKKTDIIKLLLENGAVMEPTKIQTEPLIFGAIHNKHKTLTMVKFLVENYNLELNKKYDGCYPLYFACNWKDNNIIEYLIKKGAHKKRVPYYTLPEHLRP
jgi:ankyrin repeat protein